MSACPARSTYAHDAVLLMESAGDERAPGAAITEELCGSCDHTPPCPLAPHHVGAERDGDQVRLRVLFATEPERERAVRARIEAALHRGRLTAPDGDISRWRVETSSPGVVHDHETDHAQRLTRS